LAEKVKRLTVLVTGGAGFIGSHIIDSLTAQDFKVICIDNLSTGRIENINKQAVFYKIDICDSAIRHIFKDEKPNIVIHHAAQVNVQKSLTFPLDDANTNILGSINIFENCVRHGVKKVVYASSAAIYGEPKYLGIDEQHPIYPQSCYGISKYVTEHYLRVFGLKNKLKYTVLRYANVYGPRQEENGGVVSKFFLDILAGNYPVIYGNGQQTRDFIYVMDVVNANLQAIRLANGKVLNISTNKDISINDLYRKIIKISNINVKPIFKEKREGDVSQSYLDNIRAERELKWKAITSLEDGLQETYKYYCTHVRGDFFNSF